jgi:hypothetical protein
MSEDEFDGIIYVFEHCLAQKGSPMHQGQLVEFQATKDAISGMLVRNLANSIALSKGCGWDTQTIACGAEHFVVWVS